MKLALLLFSALVLSCAYKPPKLEGINYIDIVRVEDRLRVSYYRENPLKPRKKKEKYRTKISPVCTKGRSYIALWVWNHRNIRKDWAIFERVVKDLRVSRVYVQVSRGIDRAFISRLKELNLEVFLLDGGKRIGLNFSPEHIKSLGADGFQADIEPYLNWDFNIRRENYIREYVRFLKELKKKLSPLKLSVVVPFWFDSLNYKGRSLTQHAFTHADEVVVMSYRNSLEEVLKLSLEEIELSKAYRKPLWVGVELHPQKDEHHHIYRVMSNRLEPVGKYTVRGEKLVFSFGDTKKLANLRCSGIKGFVLHSYSFIKKKYINSVK